MRTKKVGRHSVEGVGAELVFTLDSSEQIKLHAALDGNVLVCMRAVRFAAELCVFHAQRTAADSAPVEERRELESLCAIDEVREVKVEDVVADHDVWVHCGYQLLPPARKIEQSGFLGDGFWGS